MIWQEWFRDQFLSTPSARRATAVAVCRQLLTEHFYPRPPRGGRQIISFSRSMNRKFCEDRNCVFYPFKFFFLKMNYDFLHPLLIISMLRKYNK